MEADPFQIDTSNLCPHLKEILNVKYASSEALEVKELVLSKDQADTLTCCLPHIPK